MLIIKYMTKAEAIQKRDEEWKNGRKMHQSPVSRGDFVKVFEDTCFRKVELKQHKEYVEYLKLYKSQCSEGIKIMSDGFRLKEGYTKYTAHELDHHVRLGLTILYANLHDEIFYCTDAFPDTRVISYMERSEMVYTLYFDPEENIGFKVQTDNDNSLCPFNNIKVDGIEDRIYTSTHELCSVVTRNAAEFYEIDVRKYFEKDLKYARRIAISSEKFYMLIRDTAISGDVRWFFNIMTQFGSDKEYDFPYNDNFWYTDTEEERRLATDRYNLLMSARYTILGSLVLITDIFSGYKGGYESDDKYPTILVYGRNSNGVYEDFGEVTVVKYPTIMELIGDLVEEYLNNEKYSEFAFIVFDEGSISLVDDIDNKHLLFEVTRYIFINMKSKEIEVGTGRDILAISKFINNFPEQE